jgi:hypothetical protein
VRTIAGARPIAANATLRRAVINGAVFFDVVVFRDLVADYNSKLSTQVISGSGIEGEMLGVRNTPGIHRVYAMNGTRVTRWGGNLKAVLQNPSPTQLIYSRIADGIQKIHNTRFLPPTHVAMHPRRLEAFTETLGKVMLQGIDIVADEHMLADDGQDFIHVLRADDLLLWESGPRVRVLTGKDPVVQLYTYSALDTAPMGIAEIGGTALRRP